MVKARIFAHGNVQGVGYRALVKILATGMGISGVVRNVEDNRVEIFCEGHKEKLDQFLDEIKVKDRSFGRLGLRVEKLDAFWEGQEGYDDAWRQYTGFEIDYGAEGLSPFEKETLESLEMAKIQFAELIDGISSFRSDTNTNFDTMAQKYGKISNELVETKVELRQSIEETLPEKIAEAIKNGMRELIDRL